MNSALLARFIHLCFAALPSSAWRSIAIILGVPVCCRELGARALRAHQSHVHSRSYRLRAVSAPQIRSVSVGGLSQGRRGRVDSAPRSSQLPSAFPAVSLVEPDLPLCQRENIGRRAFRSGHLYVWEPSTVWRFVSRLPGSHGRSIASAKAYHTVALSLPWTSTGRSRWMRRVPRFLGCVGRTFVNRARHG